MDNMTLTEAEAKEFWPVFEENQEALFLVNERFAKLILEYAAAYLTMDDKKAAELIDEYNDIEKDRVEVLKDMTEDAEKALPGKKAFRYMQIEAKLFAIARYELAKAIPLAE